MWWPSLAGLWLAAVIANVAKLIASVIPATALPCRLIHPA